ncbi:MAG TPA: universal stress protein [Propionibacteriaceae bacterium]|nr:universal stress protein [Propionibacteriaceae bacterium]
MHVIVATDGSQQSLIAAQQLKSFADPAKITDITVVAVLSPYAAVPFANELGATSTQAGDFGGPSFENEAEAATAAIMAEFDDWGATVQRRLRSGSPAAEIVKVAEELHADLIVVASGSRGLSETVLLGSTAQRVQHSAPCPVLVSRVAPHHGHVRRGRPAT